MPISPANSHGSGYPLGLTGAVSPTRYVGGTATVAPTTGTWAVGDFVVTQDGKVFVCTVAGTPGTWVQVGSGGSLPAWWTVDSTPGAESVEFGGSVAIRGTDDTVPQLVLQAPTGSASEGTPFMQVYDEDDNLVLEVDYLGEITIELPAGGGAALFVEGVDNPGASTTVGAGTVAVTPGPAQTDPALLVGSRLWQVAPTGAMILGINAAPADALLNAGDITFWFDKTDGAAKLMLKAKQADGTVKTGSVNVQT